MEIKNILAEVITSENVYEESVENFDILTDRMNDDFIPYRVEQNVMMWLDEEGVLGEIECIFPTQLDKEIYLVKNENTLAQNGFPLIDIEKSVKVPEVKVFKNREYFILYFSELGMYNKIVISNNLSFYINNNELIAIKAEIG